MLQSTDWHGYGGAKTIPREVDHEVDLVRVDDGRDLVRREALRQVLEHVARLNPPSLPLPLPLPLPAVQRSAAQHLRSAHARAPPAPTCAMRCCAGACLIVARVFEPSSPVSA